MLRPLDKPFSHSCEQNRQPILAVLKTRFANCESLLEIGSGTGQHAAYFAPELPHLIWQTSDVVENHPGILAWQAELPSQNLRPPLALDVSRDPWPTLAFDAVFSANTAHIMREIDVEAMFAGVGRLLESGSPFLLYGPFNIDGRYTAPSNEQFDRMLRRQDPEMGVRDLAWLAQLAEQAGLDLHELIDMPADNKILHWVKR